MKVVFFLLFVIFTVQCSGKRICILISKRSLLMLSQIHHKYLHRMEQFPDCVQWLSGIVCALFGLIILAPFSAHTLIPRLVPESVWGLLFLSVGTLKVYFWKRSTWKIRRNFAFFSSCFWGFLNINLMLSDSGTFSMAANILYMSLAFFNALEYIRLGTLQNGR